MKFLVILAAFLSFAAATANAAEVWTCSYVSGTGELVFQRFELAPPDLIQRNSSLGDQHYRILQNDEFGLVGTFSFFERNQEDSSDVSVAAFTVAINKRTGDFSLVIALAGHAAGNPGAVHGKCVKN